MELDRLSVALRPRTPWEGIDLGCALGRAWFPTLWGLWWLSALPVALLALPLVGGRSDWWLLLVWWCKPLFEAPLVWWISRTLFGERPPLGAARGILRAAWTRRLLPYLLWRRLAARRSFELPISLLEGLRGAALRQRRRVLGDGAGAAWLTVISYHFEAILWGGQLLTLYYLIPDGLPSLDLAAAVTDSQSWPYWLSGIFYLLACSVMAPFYVCGGFALYIGRRTELEAWDLELAFRQARPSAAAGPRAPPDRRAQAARGRASAAALTGLLGAILLAAWPDPSAQARPVPQPLPGRAAAQALIAEVLADDAFGHTQEVTVWTYLGRGATKSAPPAPWLKRLAELAVSLGGVIKVVLMGLAVLAVALLVQRILRDWQPGPWRRRRAGTRPTTAALVALHADPDPAAADLARAVRARLAAGDPRGALALLYRGGISHLRRRGVVIPDGATEGECLRLAADHLGAEQLAPFRHLTRDWQALAYAQRVPDPQVIAARLAGWLRWTGNAAAADPGVPTPVPTEPRADTGHVG